MRRQFNFGWLSTERAAIMGFAILWVVFYHSFFDCSSLPVLEQIKKYGNTGVDIFLLLSGVGLYYACQKYGMGNSTRWIYSFYRGRLKRILPATVICMLPWYVYLYIDRRRSFSLWKFILDITSLSYWINGVNRAWYVALSLILYAVYPAVFFLLFKKCCNSIKTILYAVAIIAFAIAGNSIIALLATSWFDSVELALTRIPIFIVGCLLGPIVKAEKKCSGWLVLIAVIAVVLLPKLIQLYRKSYTTELLFLWRYLYSVVAFCVLIILALLFRSIHESFVVKFFSFIGKYTLEIYLTHTQVQTVLKEQSNGLSENAIAIIAIITSISVAIALHEALRRVTGIRK